MPIKHPAAALTALFFSLNLAACRSTPQPANNGTPADVFYLATIGESGDSPIPTLSDAESAASFGTPVADQSNEICKPTTSDDENVHYVEGAPFRHTIAPENASGKSLILSGYIYVLSDFTCLPLANALIDVWHADSNGEYDTSNDFLYRGKLETDINGRYTLTTVIPGGDLPTIQFRITHPNAVSLITRLFITEGVDLSRTLILSETDSGYTSSYDFVLSGK